MRSRILWLSLIAATTQASQSRTGQTFDEHAWNGFADRFSQASAEPTMMVALAAGTVCLQLVRKFRAHQSGRKRMLEYKLSQAGMPAGGEG